MELKTSQAGKNYKSYTLENRIQGKDKFSLFPDHPMYETLTIGSDVQESSFYLNQKGYLGMSDPSRQRNTNGTQPSSTSKTDVKLGFLEQNVKEMMTILLALGHKAGTLTPAQERAYVGTTVPKDIDWNPVEPEEEVEMPF